MYQANTIIKQKFEFQNSTRAGLPFCSLSVEYEYVTGSAVLECSSGRYCAVLLATRYRSMVLLALESWQPVLLLIGVSVSTNSTVGTLEVPSYRYPVTGKWKDIYPGFHMPSCVLKGVLYEVHVQHRGNCNYIFPDYRYIKAVPGTPQVPASSRMWHATRLYSALLLYGMHVPLLHNERTVCRCITVCTVPYILKNKKIQ